MRFLIVLLVLMGLILPFTACDNPVSKSENTNNTYPAPGPNAGQPKPTSPVQLFHYSEVELLEGHFKNALELNYQNLMNYDVDRLLFPYRRVAGLSNIVSSGYSDWGGDPTTVQDTLDGHIAGHHLSALAMTYAASRDTSIRNGVNDRMEYMLDQLQECQNANTGNFAGYAGGVRKAAWDLIRGGTITVNDNFHLNGYWVPWYNVHKMYAGLRDAYIYAGKERAKTMFLAFCDWGIGLISNLNNTQMESMLNVEFGGMNEIFADAYNFTGDVKYLNAAKRFSHAVWLNQLSGQNGSFNTHANTLIPKVVGYGKVAYATNEQQYTTAANFFWNEIVDKYCLSFGGHSLDEFIFPPSDNYRFFTNSGNNGGRTGPESCNSNNMLRLTETLFRMNPQAKHADFYERVLYNHILSTQHPTGNGYVYFTSAKPEHYRTYSTIGTATTTCMKCCVGTGMENPARHGAFIYAYNNDELYVNLFAPSRVIWSAKGVTLTQNTNFPNTETSELVVNVSSPVSFKLRIRCPWWVMEGGMQVSINGIYDYAAGGENSSYMEIDRTWQNGDKVAITLPMKITLENLYQETTHIAIMRGPILLAAKTPTEGGLRMRGLGDRWGHIADVYKANTISLAGTKEQALFKLQNMAPQEDGSFLVTNLSSRGDETLIPFYTLHDSRYMMYWRLATP